MDWWWERFDSVIREWIRNDRVSRDTWNTAVPVNDWRALQAMANRGQIAHDASMRTAVWEALTYQRGHLNAFLTVLNERLGTMAADDRTRSIGIVDLGCGAGTVAFAFGEAFNSKTTFHYVGQDHNRASRELCRDMLSAGVSPRGGTVKVVKDLAKAFDHAIDDMPSVDRLFVTSSYLLCQDSMTTDATRAIAAQIERLVTEKHAVRLVIADAPLPRSLAPLLISTLEGSDAVAVDERLRWSDTYSYMNQFPAMKGRKWRDQRSGTVEGHYLLIRRA